MKSPPLDSLLVLCLLSILSSCCASCCRLLPRTNAPNPTCCQALILLDRPELDFLCKLNPADRTRFVDFIREMVIATDVTTTMPKAKEFTAKVAAGETPTPQEVMTILIKAADISNPSRSPAVYKR